MDGIDLTGRTAVISGSTRGLGFAFAHALGRAGAAVVINGRSEPACAQALERLHAAGIQAAAVAGSVAEEETADALVATCVERFGRVDVAINNAGVTRDRTLVKMSADEFDTVVAIHLRGAWLLSRAAARAMRTAATGGSILNIVSGSALFGLVGQCNYAAAKGGMLALTRALSLELARAQINVNALYPVALTDMTRPVAELARERSSDGSIPFGDADEVAPIVCFLASEQARGITGQVMHFDGRELVVWSHPQPRAAGHRDDAWSTTDIAAFFAGDVLEPLHPDRWGAGTRGALDVKARS